MWKYIFTIVLIVSIISLIVYIIDMNKQQITTTRYVALGDSYTIGEGATQEQSWPSLLTKHLQEQKVKIELVANPSVTGWTTQQLIDYELPVYDSSNPTFATLLIGVNDFVQGIDADSFHKNLNIILNEMQAKLTNKHNLVLVTIPDFSVTPTGRQYCSNRDCVKGISEFNMIIKQEGKKRGLSVIDIYPLTQAMKGNLIASDGLHPSAKEYKLWEELIYPTVFNLLKRIQ